MQIEAADGNVGAGLHLSSAARNHSVSEGKMGNSSDRRVYVDVTVPGLWGDQARGDGDMVLWDTGQILSWGFLGVPRMGGVLLPTVICAVALFLVGLPLFL